MLHRRPGACAALARHTPNKNHSRATWRRAREGPSGVQWREIRPGACTHGGEGFGVGLLDAQRRCPASGRARMPSEMPRRSSAAGRGMGARVTATEPASATSRRARLQRAAQVGAPVVAPSRSRRCACRACPPGRRGRPPRQVLAPPARAAPCRREAGPPAQVRVRHAAPLRNRGSATEPTTVLRSLGGRLATKIPQEVDRRRRALGDAVRSDLPRPLEL